MATHGTLAHNTTSLYRAVQTDEIEEQTEEKEKKWKTMLSVAVENVDGIANDSLFRCVLAARLHTHTNTRYIRHDDVCFFCVCTKISSTLSIVLFSNSPTQPYIIYVSTQYSPDAEWIRSCVFAGRYERKGCRTRNEISFRMCGRWIGWVVLRALHATQDVRDENSFYKWR